MPQVLAMCACMLTHFLPVHIDVEPLRRVARRKPALWVFVVKGPRRDDDEEGERSTGEARIQRQPDILGKVADEESDDLGV